MKLIHLSQLILLAVPVTAGAESMLDRLDSALTWSSDEGEWRARLSGTLDLEGYHYSGSVPGFVFTDGSDLLNPRLSAFLDMQLGAHVYGFAQARFDRGFDPQDGAAQARLDEYAVRWTPWEDSRLNVQIGQFATVVGNWTLRHLSWDNPFIGAPGPYTTMTPISEESLFDPLDDHHFSADESYEYNPIIWGPSYATGVAVSGKLGHWEYAAEWKNAALSSRPEAWTLRDMHAGRGTFSGRVGWRPNEAWNVGFSASDGVYMSSVVSGDLPPRVELSDFRQTVIAHDISYAWRHFQFWGEVFGSRFSIPGVGDGDVLGWYVEAKYKFTPRWSGAVRLNQMLYGELPGADGVARPWGEDSWRADFAVTFQMTEFSQVKLQYCYLTHPGGESPDGHMIAAQFTVRF